MYFDTHAHYDARQFDRDRRELLASLPASGIDYVVDPGCDGASSMDAVRLAAEWSFLYAAVGWQPEEWKSWDGDSIALIRELAGNKKVVAIGEIGLDYYWDKEHKDIQKEMFASQLALARELELPVIVHDREAHADCLEMIDRYSDVQGVFHCFSGSAEMARELVKRGWYLGFDGPVTYKNNQKAAEVLSVTPIDRILLETDSPYLTPAPHRGERNDSTLLPYIAARVADLKAVTTEQIAQITTQNAKRLFKM